MSAGRHLTAFGHAGIFFGLAQLNGSLFAAATTFFGINCLFEAAALFNTRYNTRYMSETVTGPISFQSSTEST